jgi:putative transcriptional regulator
MINCNLPVLLAERRLKVSDAVRATGISQSTLHKLYHAQTSRIDFETLDKLCEFLNVEIGDLLTYAPNKKNDGDRI